MSFLSKILKALTSTSTTGVVDATEDNLHLKHSSTETFDSMPMDELHFNNVQQHHHHNEDSYTGVHHG